MIWRTSLTSTPICTKQRHKLQHFWHLLSL
jgi:hypothetical protein